MDLLLKRLGKPGLYHYLICTLLAITWWSVALGNVSMTFYGYTPKYHCNVPGESHRSYEKDTSNSIVGIARNVTLSEDSCYFSTTYKDVNGNLTSSTNACTSFTFENDPDSISDLNTIVSQWNLVCDDKYKVSLSSTVFFLGVFCGALIFGFISDHLGRKKTLALCLYVQMPIGLGIAFAPNFLAFTILRFFHGVWLQGISTVAFVHCIEFFRQKYRGVVMVGFGISWAFGQVLTASLAYGLPNWKHMQMVASAVAIITMPYFWWIPESPRWLLVKGRVDEIISTFIARAAKVNRLDVLQTKEYAREQLEDALQQQTLSVGKPKSQSFIGVVRSKTLLFRLVVMCYIWCVSSMAYYVIILNMRNLAGNRYFNFTIGAALEIVINFVSIFIMAWCGRKKPLMIGLLLAAVLCLVGGLLPERVGDYSTGEWLTAIAISGKMVMAAVLCFMFVYAAELFPTFARGSCMALCGSSLRIGGMLAPQVLFLNDVTFRGCSHILIAAAMFVPSILLCFMPETIGTAMPNTLEEAINLVPQQTSKSPQVDQLLKLDETSSGDTSENASLPSEEDV